MFHHCSVLPFGSSVNGFGQIHGDQDMILLLNGLDNVVSKNQNIKNNFYTRDMFKKRVRLGRFFTINQGWQSDLCEKVFN